MATQVGPDRFRLPELNDFANVPADMAALVESLRPNLIGHAASIAERTAKYGTPKSSASPNSVQAPEGTVVVSKEMSAIWIKTSSTSDEWYALMKRGERVGVTNTMTATDGTFLRLCEQRIPETGIYSLIGSASGERNEPIDGTVREIKLFLNSEMLSGVVQPPTFWWVGSVTAVVPCTAGDIVYMQFIQRAASTFPVKGWLSYQRIM